MQIKSSTRVAGVVAVCLLVASARAEVVKNISTGFDQAAGARLGNGVVDSDWIVAPGGTGGLVGTPIIARSSPLPSLYLADSASTASRWVGINTGQGLEGISAPAGTFFFQTSVDLTGFDHATAFISDSRFAIDDGLHGIQINGVTIYTLPGGRVQTRFDVFETVLPPDLGLGEFGPGVNTITFILENAVPGTPVAMRLEANVSATVPEPTGAAAAAFGAVLGVSSMHRRTQRRLAGGR